MSHIDSANLKKYWLCQFQKNAASQPKQSWQVSSGPQTQFTGDLVQ